MDTPDPLRHTWAAWWLDSYAHRSLEGHLWTPAFPHKDSGMASRLPCGPHTFFLIWPDASGLLLRRREEPLGTRDDNLVHIEIFPEIFELHQPGESFAAPPTNITWAHPGTGRLRARIDAVLASPEPFPAFSPLPPPWTIVPHPQQDVARLGFLRAWVSLWAHQAAMDAVHPLADLRGMPSLSVRDDGGSPLFVASGTPGVDLDGFHGFLTAKLEEAMARFHVPRGALYQDMWMFTLRKDRPDVVCKGIERHPLRINVPALSAHQALAFLETGVLPT